MVPNTYKATNNTVWVQGQLVLRNWYRVCVAAAVEERKPKDTTRAERFI